MIDWTLLGPLALITIAVALLFDFYNGLHDAANAIATVVATKALPVWGALLLASSFNFLGAFAGTAVAAAVGKGIIVAEIITTEVILAALIGAIFWSVLTIILGIPISSSQSLIGGLIGSALAAAGLHAVQWPPVAEMRAIGIVLLQGGLVGAAIGLAIGLAAKSRIRTSLLLGFAFGSATWLILKIAGKLAVPGMGLIGAVVGALVGYIVARARNQHTGTATFLGFVLGTLLYGLSGLVLGDRIPDISIFGIHLTHSIQILGVEKLAMGKLTATLLFIVYSPLIGFLLAFVFSIVVAWAFRRARPGKVKHLFRGLQILSSSFYSHGHGKNDAQKTMGVITALLVANGALATFNVPFEVIVASGLAIGLGTLIGGHKIVRTMGSKLTQLDTSQGFCAESSSAIGLSFFGDHGVPVSTTHSITGAILGVGAFQRASAVSWGTARRIVSAWIITIPMAAVVAAMCYWVIHAIL